MIRFNDIISAVQQKRPKRHHPSGDKWDVFHNTLELKEKTKPQTGKKGLFDTQNSKKAASNSGSVISNLQKTSQMSLARKDVKINRNNIITNISVENNKNINTYARASDKRDTFKFADCDICPAPGFWDYKGPGKWCFHRAYFLGKSGHPIACDTAKHDCPLTNLTEGDAITAE